MLLPIEFLLIYATLVLGQKSFEKNGGHQHGIVITGTKGQHNNKQIIPTGQLPCCPNTCPQCLYGDGRKRRQPVYIDSRGAEYVEPQVVRRKPGRLLQKNGELLKSKKPVSGGSVEKAMSNNNVDPDEGRYTYEKGRLKPVVMFDEAEFYKWEQWKPLEACIEDSDCPCFNCQCCYTETVICTVEDYCEATVIDIVTVFKTQTTTKKFATVVSVTASIVFTLTNSAEFRSTEFISVTLSDAVVVTEFNTTIATTVSNIYATTATAVNFSITPIVIKTISGGPTVTVTQDVISLIETGQTTLFGGSTTIGPLSEILTFSQFSYVPFTVNGKDRTITTTDSRTVEVTATLDPVVFYSTPGIAISTESVTATSTMTITKSVKKCNDEVETVRVTPTKTLLLTIGTATPSKVPCCQGDLCRA